MGTNYYYYHPPLRNVCEHCGRGDPAEPPLHIGKSSAGWCFSLHVYPQDGIRSLEDWQQKLQLPGVVVRNGYDEIVTVQELLATITERSSPNAKSPQWLRANDATLGPLGLARHKIDGRYVVGHGEGTWDYLIGEFF